MENFRDSFAVYYQQFRLKFMDYFYINGMEWIIERVYKLDKADKQMKTTPTPIKQASNEKTEPVKKE